MGQLRRNWRGILAFVLCTAGGAILGRSIGFALAIENAEDRILGYTIAYASHTEQQYAEVRRLLIEANSDARGRCSDEDLLALRRFVFESPVVADMGRLDNHRLICTTGIGRLDAPIDEVEPTYVSPTGMRWFTDVDLAISDRVRGLILELGTANAVLDPRVLNYSDAEGTQYTIVAVDPNDQAVIRASGAELPLDPAEVVARFRANSVSGAVEGEVFPGYVGAMHCHISSIICVIGLRSVDDIVAWDGGMIDVFTVTGGVVGAGISLSTLLALRRDRALPNRLRRAIKHDRLHVEYQPQVNFRDRRVIGAEALVRWVDSDGVRHRPDEFIAIAERHGFISSLTDLVIRHVVEDMAELLAERPDMSVSINFAAADLTDGRLVDRLQRASALAGVPARQFGIELTERAAGNDPRVRATLAAAQEAGHKVAIDDFGVGYSNLGYLQTMPVDYLKIDKSFTDTVGTGSVRASIVPQILDMAGTLDLGIVVEGLETEPQVAYFAERGIRFGQGWLFAPAMPAAAFRTWLDTWEHKEQTPAAMNAAGAASD
ncbi:MAG: EAL domain-containing protein [Rhodospirillaceae bacterium]|nr:EAL domain-containing protein [Rhodospirillaceae bacterium]